MAMLRLRGQIWAAKLSVRNKFEYNLIKEEERERERWVMIYTTASEWLMIGIHTPEMWICKVCNFLYWIDVIEYRPAVESKTAPLGILRLVGFEGIGGQYN